MSQADARFCWRAGRSDQVRLRRTFVLVDELRSCCQWCSAGAEHRRFCDVLSLFPPVLMTVVRRVWHGSPGLLRAWRRTLEDCMVLEVARGLGRCEQLPLRGVVFSLVARASA